MGMKVMAAEAASALKHAAALRLRRVRLAEARLTSFARIYLPDRFDLPWCEMHGESGAALGELRRGWQAQQLRAMSSSMAEREDHLVAVHKAQVN